MFGELLDYTNVGGFGDRKELYLDNTFGVCGELLLLDWVNRRKNNITQPGYFWSGYR